MARSTIIQRSDINTQIDTPGSYDNATSSLTADSVQAAIDEISSVVHEELTLPAGNNTTTQSAELTGQQLTLKKATATTDGVMSSEDKVKLDNVAPAPLQPNTVVRGLANNLIQLENDSPVYHYYFSTNGAGDVTLPSSPNNGTHFVVINNKTATNNFLVNTVLVKPGETYEVIYDGTEWIVL